jgi:hypothetical protein
MTCVSLTPTQKVVLARLAASHPKGDEETVEEFRRWGWVMLASYELTGTGWAHADELPSGILTTGLSRIASGR